MLTTIVRMHVVRNRRDSLVRTNQWESEPASVRRETDVLAMHFRRLSRQTRFAVHTDQGRAMRCGIIERIAETFLGFDAADVRAMGPGIVPCLMHADHLRSYAEHVSLIRTLRAGESAALEFKIRDHARKWRWIETQHVAVPGDSPNAAGDLIALAIETTRLRRVLSNRRHAEPSSI